jgi:hypothetical protein
MVYASFTATPMHDLMVTISLIFFLVDALALIQALYVSREMGLFVAGCVCLAVLVASATIYYTGHYVSVLPWAQRASFGLFTIWLGVWISVFLAYGCKKEKRPNHASERLPAA